MSQIRAFVGHSFTDEDEQVVRSFTDYFNTLKESLPSFTWDHAIRAEPSKLDDKVLRLATGKNLFIGICTRKEMVIGEEKLQPILLNSKMKKAAMADFRWKTSDWILQEIGMAIGMGMKTILLHEKDVRVPGGLQGNTEYIEFDRDRPADSFSKILQMVSSISPKELNSVVAATEPNKTEENAREEATKFDFRQPSPKWTQRHYELAALESMFEEDGVSLTNIDSEYRKTEAAKEDGALASWDAHLEWARINAGKGGSIDRLVKLSLDHPKNSKVVEYLARAYIVYDEHLRSAEQFMAAGELVSDESKQLGLWRLAAREFAADGKVAESNGVLDKIRAKVQGGSTNETVLLRGLLDISELEKDTGTAIAAMERLVALKPDDTKTRFNLALAQSEDGKYDMALHHYLKIPYQERSPAAWNNIGVAFDQFEIPVRAVQAFRKSAELNETLAMSNLGNKMLNVGLLDEAKAECDKALNLKDQEPHKNIGDLLARLTETPDLETKRIDEVLDSAKPKIEFYKKMGRAIALNDVNSFDQVWVNENCQLTPELNGNEFKLSGNFEREFGMGLAGLVGALSAGPPTKTKHKVHYTGKIRGGVFFGSVTRSRDGESILASAGNSKAVYMVLNDEKSELIAMEEPELAEPTFYSLKRLFE